MAEDVVLCETDGDGVATITFNRPEVNNAYNAAIVGRLLDLSVDLAADDAVRLVVLRGKGRHFQAGADLKWLMEVGTMTPAENLQVSQRTTDALRFLDAFPKPTVALIHGGCFGGGTGIAAACDIVLASDDAIFAITEARWGVMAGPAFPQLIARMGEQNVRHFALTCERFGAEKARELGLVDEVCPAGKLDELAAPVIASILKGGPTALRETKRLIMDVAGLDISDARAAELAAEHAAKRQTEEAAEGLASFIEKRDPAWYPGAA